MFLNIDYERIVRSHINKVGIKRFEQIFAGPKDNAVLARFNQTLVHLDPNRLNKIYQVLQIILKLNPEEEKQIKQDDEFLLKTKMTRGEGKFNIFLH
jgi:hypothetical protein